MAEPADALQANAAFYRAFAEGDAEAMAALWAQTLPVACLHPGAALIAGRAAVIESWRAVLRTPPPVRCESPQLLDLGTTAVVLCYERIGEGRLAATNIFAREGERWRMVHHHAGPAARPPSAAPDPAAPPRHRMH